MSKNTKKSHIGLIIFIIILVLAIAGGAGFYFYQRQQPRKAAEKFLSSMQKMDFNTMESMLQPWIMQTSATPHIQISLRPSTKK